MMSWNDYVKGFDNIDPDSAVVRKYFHGGRFYCEKISIAELASLAGYSDYYLSRKFKEETGMNILTYINKQKIEYAKKLLTTTDDSVQSISDALQFCAAVIFQACSNGIPACSPGSTAKRTRACNPRRATLSLRSGHFLPPRQVRRLHVLDAVLQFVEVHADALDTQEGNREQVHKETQALLRARADSLRLPVITDYRQADPHEERSKGGPDVLGKPDNRTERPSIRRFPQYSLYSAHCKIISAPI